MTDMTRAKACVDILGGLTSGLKDIMEKDVTHGGYVLYSESANLYITVCQKGAIYRFSSFPEAFVFSSVESANKVMVSWNHSVKVSEGMKVKIVEVTRAKRLALISVGDMISDTVACLHDATAAQRTTD